MDLRPFSPRQYPGLLYQTDMILMAEKVKHSRQIYGALDLLGELGGVYEMIILAFSIFLSSVSKHSFVLKAVKKMYLGRTGDQRLFKQKKKKWERGDGYDSPDRIKKEIDKHRKIRVRLVDSLKLFWANSRFGCCCSPKLWKNVHKFKKLYRVGENRIEKELNIVKIMKNIKDIKICLRNSIMDDRTKYEIRHSNKKVIDLDDTHGSSSDYHS